MEQRQQESQAKIISDALERALTKEVLEDPKMKLSREEREWAMEIKAAAAEIPELDPLSDFMYTQFAIFTLANPDDTNLEVVLEKIANYQGFLQEHNIRDGVFQDACKALDKTFRELIPGHFLAFSYHFQKGSYVTAWDLTQFDQTVFADIQKCDTCLAAVHSTNHACFPDFTAVRNGLTDLYECSGYDWKDPSMFNRQCVQKAAEHENIYPCLKKVKFYNTGMFLNLAVSVARRVFPPSFTENIEVGLKVEGDLERLDQLFVIPDLDHTNERNLRRIKESLKMRFHNESHFRLEGASS